MPQNIPSKKVPMRMCVACREMKPKRELLRIVVPSKDSVTAVPQIDFKGKLPGRGAYICRNSECFLKAKKSNALGRALECEISDELITALEKEAGGAGE